MHLWPVKQNSYTVWIECKRFISQALKQIAHFHFLVNSFLATLVFMISTFFFYKWVILVYILVYREKIMAKEGTSGLITKRKCLIMLGLITKAL